jgi:IS1 family transposase
MNRLTADTRARIVSCLLEGCSIRSTCRMTGAAKKTVMRLLVETGEACEAYQREVFTNLSTRRVQLDEVWTFNFCKKQNVTPEIAEKNPDAGDVWLWVALDSDTRLVFSWNVGGRDYATGREFIADVASRVKNRVQVTSDGFPFYPSAMEEEFGEDVDFATLTKIYSATSTGKYSPPRFLGATSEVLKGDPDPRHIATSYVERQNWALRTTVRRYTRLSNGFSRKLRNHRAAVALNYFAYNFVKVNRTLRVTPAMAAGVTERLWDVSDIIALLVASESKKAA